jgi:cellulose synthase/poly-beta-1,6-N-acetylglucosamine synthase-like glycosyltransferase
MTILAYFFLLLYIVSLSCIGIYCLFQFHLFFVYILRKETKDTPKVDAGTNVLPHVTIQLPIFNEKYVAARLIDNITSFDYPKDKLTILVLDDSTDETLEISRTKVQEFQNKGFDITLLHRTDRSGYKAGALKTSMPYVKSEFVAIFDADFLPEKDFLKKTIPHFTDKKIGVVQTRWEHINQNHSLLTEMQAMQLNVHFTVEQKGRHRGDYLLQFNGTAGVWRVNTIEDAGGWEADTLTEDLDLSYRAQLKGWKIKYLEEVGSPAELPPDIYGLKSQQFRWMKGGAENAKKLLSGIWASSLSIPKKIHATSHLMASSVFIAVLCLGLSSVPLIFLKPYIHLPYSFLQFFLVSLASIIVLYFSANVIFLRKDKNIVWQIFKFVVIFPLFMSLSMAMAFHNSIAVWQGWIGKKSAFIRTPKYGITRQSIQTNALSYFKKSFNGINVGESMLAIYFVLALVFGIKEGVYDFLFLHGMLALGYLSLMMYAVKARWFR